MSIRVILAKIILATVCFSAFVVFPLDVSAATATGISQFAGCSGTDCSACNIVDLTNGLIKWLIGFLFVLFAVLVAYAGFGLVTSGGNHHALDEAKSRFMNAFIGMIIILSAWLIVDTIMRGLVGNASNPGSVPQSINSDGEVTGWLFWTNVQCYDQSDTTPQEFKPEVFTPAEMDEFLIDQGQGEIGEVTISTPAGPQVAGLKPCDEASMVSVNAFNYSVKVHKQFASSLRRVDAAWRAKGGNNFYRVTSVGGYNCRKIAGSSRWSNHAYGVAVDINPAQNPHCPSWPACGGRNILITNMPVEFRQIFRSEGWGWGGNWNSSKDAMHFSKASGEGGNMRGD